MKKNWEEIRHIPAALMIWARGNKIQYASGDMCRCNIDMLETVYFGSCVKGKASK